MPCADRLCQTGPGRASRTRSLSLFYLAQDCPLNDRPLPFQMLSMVLQLPLVVLQPPLLVDCLTTAGFSVMDADVVVVFRRHRAQLRRGVRRLG